MNAPHTLVRAIALLLALAPATASAQLDRDEPPLRWRARHDVMLQWAPRYVLDTSPDPIGLEQQFWRRVDVLPLYHRVALDATNVMGRVDLHFAGWGAVDLLLDSGGGVGAGDVAIGYAEVAIEPVRLWAGRRFVTFGPPGGLHVDGGGASVRAPFGMIAEAFVGRPVTPVYGSLIGPQPSFEGPSTVAYGARIAYADAGRFGATAGYAELWSHGIVGSRTIDVAAYGTLGDLRLDAATKIDARSAGFMQARATASWRILAELGVDAQYLHLEAGRWIPPWSILSVFETSTFDEASVGATVRPMRALALRAELAGRLYSSSAQQDERLGYRAEVSARIVPAPTPGVLLRAHVSRRDDGVIGYTVLQGGVSFDPIDLITLTVDGAFAIDDRAERESAVGRLAIDVDVGAHWVVGGTLALARTPIVPAETRAMARASWTPGGP